MNYFIKGTLNSSFEDLKPTKFIKELPNSFVGVSNTNQTVYDFRLMIKEIYRSEYGHIKELEISAQIIMERMGWCYQHAGELYNESKPLLYGDPEIILLYFRDEISNIIDCIPNGTRVELDEFMIYRQINI